ncbi:MAG: DCC1-like thiol-disulfide oxidoreductase family protein [Planctomycetota bacterium]
MTAHRRSAWFFTEAAPAPRAWVCYDAECALCTAGARRFAPLLARRGIETVPLQAEWVRARLGLRPDQMAFIAADGQTFGGAEAVARVCREIGWAWPAWAASRVPGVGALMRAGYRWVSARRHCAGGACRIEKRSDAVTWEPLVVLPAAVFALREALPAWLWMWALCAAFFAGFKWVTLRKAPPARLGASLAYVFTWPGMDAKRFLHGRAKSAPRTSEWAAAAVKVAVGVALFFCVPRFVADPLLAAWIAMAGLIFAVHCGAFHLASCAWRAAGRDADPVMNAPLLATSPSGFWSGRWNRGFSDLARDLVVRPLRRAPGLALFTVFALSGLVHELVISVPARGGWGLPTAYFVLQGAAVALERSRLGKRLGLDRGLTGRLFAWTVVAGPAFFLFHPPFVHGVVLPMLRAAGVK